MVVHEILAAHARLGRGAQALDHLDHVLLLQRLEHAGAHGFHHGGRRTGRRVDAEQRVGIEAGQAAFGQRGHLGVQRRAVRAADGQQLELAGLHLLEARARIEPELQLAAEHVVQRRAGALVGHVDGIDLGRLLEHFAGQVGRAAGPRRAVGQLARIGLQVFDEVLHAAHGQAGAGFQEHMHAGHGGHGDQVLFRIEGQLAVDQRVDADAAARAQQQRVAVLGRAHGLADTDIAVGAGLVVHHHGLAQHLAHGGRDRPAHHVGRAAGGEVDDQADGAVRPCLGLCGGCQAQRHAQCGPAFPDQGT